MTDRPAPGRAPSLMDRLQAMQSELNEAGGSQVSYNDVLKRMDTKLSMKLEAESAAEEEKKLDAAEARPSPPAKTGTRRKMPSTLEALPEKTTSFRGAPLRTSTMRHLSGKSELSSGPSKRGSLSRMHSSITPGGFVRTGNNETFSRALVDSLELGQVYGGRIRVATPPYMVKLEDVDHVYQIFLDMQRSSGGAITKPAFKRFMTQPKDARYFNPTMLSPELQKTLVADMYHRLDSEHKQHVGLEDLLKVFHRDLPMSDIHVLANHVRPFHFEDLLDEADLAKARQVVQEKMIKTGEDELAVYQVTGILGGALVDWKRDFVAWALKHDGLLERDQVTMDVVFEAVDRGLKHVKNTLKDGNEAELVDDVPANVLEKVLGPGGMEAVQGQDALRVLNSYIGKRTSLPPGSLG